MSVGGLRETGMPMRVSHEQHSRQVIALIIRHWCGDLGGDFGPFLWVLVTERHWSKPLLLAGLRKVLSSEANRRQRRANCSARVAAAG